MKADKTNMLSLALTRLKPDRPAPFPLYIFLQKNNRMVPVRLQGDALGEAQYQELLRNNHNELWVPKSHEAEVSAFLDYLEKTGSFPSAAEVEKNAERSTEELELENVTSKDSENIEDAERLEKARESEDYSTEKQGEKGNELGAKAKALLKEIKETGEKGTIPRRDAAEKAKLFADDFLKQCLEQDSLYENILLLRSIQDPTEHSVYVGSIAALIAVAMEKSDATEVANILAAATFHDIGLKDVPSSILNKTENEWNVDERIIYESHVEKGVEILKNAEDKIPNDVIRMIQEHHEKNDGNGFPHKKQKTEILTASKILMAANEFSLLCEGRRSNGEYSPSEAMTILQDEAPAGKNFHRQIDQLFTSS